MLFSLNRLFKIISNMLDPVWITSPMERIATFQLCHPNTLMTTVMTEQCDYCIRSRVEIGRSVPSFTQWVCVHVKVCMWSPPEWNWRTVRLLPGSWGLCQSATTSCLHRWNTLSSTYNPAGTKNQGLLLRQGGQISKMYENVYTYMHWVYVACMIVDTEKERYTGNEWEKKINVFTFIYALH